MNVSNSKRCKGHEKCGRHQVSKLDFNYHFLSEKKKVPGGTFAIITNGTLGTFIASSVLCFICD